MRFEYIVIKLNVKHLVRKCVLYERLWVCVCGRVGVGEGVCVCVFVPVYPLKVKANIMSSFNH